MYNKSWKDFEVAAKKLCSLQGLDPEGKTQVSHPEGFAVCLYHPTWTVYAKELHEHWLKNKLIQETIGHVS